MRRTNKKGFTIVELVIVIAVIAILAAVLIPTFASLVQKANESADIQLVRQVNTILATDAATNGIHKTAHDALSAVRKNGMDVSKLTPTSEGRQIVWDSVNDRFALVEEKDGTEIYPSDKKTPSDKVALFVISDTYDTTLGFSIYLSDAFEGTSLGAVTTGLDVGDHTDIDVVTYTGDKEVIIRTASEACTLSMSQGTVNHYGVALKAVVSGGVYNCFASLMDKAYTGDETPTTLFAGGSGTKENPYFIANGTQLQNLAKLNETMNTTPQYVKLVSDVRYEGEVIEAYFNGEFDGNGHSLTFKGKRVKDGWPSLFEGTRGETTIKNVEYVCDGMVMSFAAYLSWDGGTTIYENVVAKSAGDEIIPTYMYGCSAFGFSNSGTVYFRNCTNEANYSVAGEGGYGGIFIGNYPLEGTFTSFENCVNKGTVSGTYLGFFVGNDSYNIEIVTSPEKTIVADKATLYISGCRNEGVMIGAEAVSAFGCNGATMHQIHTAADQALTADQFQRGTMLVNQVTVGLNFSGNAVTVEPATDTSVSKYCVEFMAGISYKNGSGRFSFSEEIVADQVDSTTIQKVTAIISKADYEQAGGTYDAAQEKTGTQYNYIVVKNADGSRMVVVNMDDVGNFVSFKKVESAVTAYDANGIALGYKSYS